MAESAIKVTLSSGKVVLLREMKIKHQNLATQAVGSRAGDNNFQMATLMQQELVKILLISVNDVAPSGVDREDLDNLFSFSEYTQVTKVIGKMMGGETGELPTEIVSIGKP